MGSNWVDHGHGRYRADLFGGTVRALAVFDKALGAGKEMAAACAAMAPDLFQSRKKRSADGNEAIKIES